MGERPWRCRHAVRGHRYVPNLPMCAKQDEARSGKDTYPGVQTHALNICALHLTNTPTT